MCVSKEVNEYFTERLAKVLKLIQQYEIDFVQVGIFGSFARGDFKASSDLDICIVTNSRPTRRISGSLREEAEELGVDIIYVTEEFLLGSQTPFGKNLRRDYRRLL